MNNDNWFNKKRNGELEEKKEEATLSSVTLDFFFFLKDLFEGGCFYDQNKNEDLKFINYLN